MEQGSDAESKFHMLMTLTFYPKPLSFGSCLQPAVRRSAVLWYHRTAAREVRIATSANGSKNVLCVHVHWHVRWRAHTLSGHMSCCVSRLYFGSPNAQRKGQRAGQRNRSRSLTFIRPPLHRRTHQASDGQRCASTQALWLLSQYGQKASPGPAFLRIIAQFCRSTGSFVPAATRPMPSLPFELREAARSIVRQSRRLTVVNISTRCDAVEFR